MTAQRKKPSSVRTAAEQPTKAPPGLSLNALTAAALRVAFWCRTGDVGEGIDLTTHSLEGSDEAAALQKLAKTLPPAPFESDPTQLNIFVHGLEPLVRCPHEVSTRHRTRAESRWLAEMNKATVESFKAPNQTGGTCYANACAAAIFLANCRIVGRQTIGFEALREQIIDEFGYDGGNEKKVLEAYANVHGRLHWEKVDEEKARNVLATKGHPLVATGTFNLTQKQWKRFDEFYESNPKGTLRQLTKTSRGKEGHVVLATGVDRHNNLVLLNSWGRKWGNKGSFKVANAGVLNLEFYWVYFLEDDVSETEKAICSIQTSVLQQISQHLPRQSTTSSSDSESGSSSDDDSGSYFSTYESFSNSELKVFVL